MYDERGRLIESVSTPESEWTEHERALMVALEVYRAGLCQRCGGDLATTTNPLHNIDNPFGTHLYKPSKKTRCFRCTALMESEHVHSSNKNVKHPGAVQHFVELVPRARPTRDRPRRPKADTTLTEDQKRRRAQRAAQRERRQKRG